MRYSKNDDGKKRGSEPKIYTWKHRNQVGGSEEEWNIG